MNLVKYQYIHMFDIKIIVVLKCKTKIHVLFVTSESVCTCKQLPYFAFIFCQEH